LHICKYKKSQLNFNDFEPYIYDAIKREKMLKERLEELKNKLGGNVGLLIKEMIQQKSLEFRPLIFYF